MIAQQNRKSKSFLKIFAKIFGKDLPASIVPSFLQIHEAADFIHNVARGAKNTADCGFAGAFSGAEQHTDRRADGESDADSLDELIAAHAIHKRFLLKVRDFVILVCPKFRVV